MQAVILAGGLGTRISEESHARPKPMVEIGNYPILWHIMKYYSMFGVKRFVICAGYKSYKIKEYFSNLGLHNSDVTFKIATNEVIKHTTTLDDWEVTVVDTGLHTQTGGRLKRVASFLDDQIFLTYGDGLSDLDISALLKTHSDNKNEITVTAVAPPGRFGALTLDGPKVLGFSEKPAGDGSKINGGFFVVNKSFLKRIDGDTILLEQEPLQSAASDGALGAYEHEGFWQPMDTVREKKILNDLWDCGSAPWARW